MDIREFILESVYRGKDEGLSRKIAVQSGISRQAAQKHLRKLIKEGLLRMTGTTKAARYSLVPLVDEVRAIPLSSGLEEDVIWRTTVRPLLGDLHSNVLAICNHGFTEMFNNVLDHSEGTRASVRIKVTAYHVEMSVEDNGVGIFHKIQRDFGLEDERHAILELSKGKLTSDPKRHSGEGIFFTSRMFDRFSIFSGKQVFVYSQEDSDWLLENIGDHTGTAVVMEIGKSNSRTVKEVFDRYSSVDHPGFYRTQVPVFLVQYGDENLVSRSQAKRVLTRVERFTEVILDFRGVSQIGQAFADEIFRVFRQEHPEVNLVAINTTEEIDWMIQRAKNQA